MITEFSQAHYRFKSLSDRFRLFTRAPRISQPDEVRINSLTLCVQADEFAGSEMLVYTRVEDGKLIERYCMNDEPRNELMDQLSKETRKAMAVGAVAPLIYDTVAYLNGLQDALKFALDEIDNTALKKTENTSTNC